MSVVLEPGVMELIEQLEAIRLPDPPALAVLKEMRELIGDPQANDVEGHKRVLGILDDAIASYATV